MSVLVRPTLRNLRPLALAALGACSAARADTLNAPVTVNANNATSALTINQTGTGRGAIVSIRNANNNLSAVRGQTNGRGAGVHGLNSGTTGPAGYFEVSNPSTRQPAVIVKADNEGDAMRIISSGPGQGLVVNRIRRPDGGASLGPAISAENTAIDSHSSAGEFLAIYGHGLGTGIAGEGDSVAGVSGHSQYAIGVQGESESGAGVSATSVSGSAVYAKSTTGLAGEFHGAVTVSGPVRAASFQIVSDRDQKQDFMPVDGEALLDRISALPMTRWAYKATPAVQHLGPMAQDFKAAFNLGSDERHIEVVDAAGVSLAAVQALLQQLKARDAQIAVQQARLDALEAQVVAIARDGAQPVAAAASLGTAHAAPAVVVSGD